jgi:hypothetical protein
LSPVISSKTVLPMTWRKPGASSGSRKPKCNWVLAVHRSQTTLSDRQFSELLFDCISM